MSDSWRPRGLQPTRLLHPWDFPGKRTGVRCHHLLHERSLATLYSGLAFWLALASVVQFSSVAQSDWVSDSLRPHELQHTRPPCPSPIPGVYFSVMSNSLQPHGLQHARVPCPSLCSEVCSNSCPLSSSCHPIISSSVTPFSSCPQSFPASGSFPVSQLFASGGQSIGASALVLPMNIHGWFPLGLTGLISLFS